jgi:hypothetical protein
MICYNSCKAALHYPRQFMANSMVGSMGNRMPKQSLAGYDVQQLQNFTPNQMQLFEQMFSNVSPDSYTSRLAHGDEGLFNEMEAPAFRQFAQLQGENASRFSGMGMGARRGSGFRNSMDAATSNFAQDLQSRRQELQRQAIKDLMGMSSELLGQRPYENVITDKKKSFWDKLIGGSAPLIGAGAGFLAGGPAGAAIGASAGSAFSNSWNK